MTENLKKKYDGEKVLVLDSCKVPKLPEGFSEADEETILELNTPAYFYPRYLAEGSGAVRQPIPYIVLMHGDKIFATRRLSGSGEGRLVDKVSIGLGGHVNPCDDVFDPANVFEKSMLRELKEELDFDDRVSFDWRYIGMINDTSDPVGKDHIGIVYLVKSNSDKIDVREKDKHEGGWESLSELESLRDKMENWSRMVFDYIIKSGIS